MTKTSPSITFITIIRFAESNWPRLQQRIASAMRLGAAGVGRSQRAEITVVPAMINGRVTQHEAFAAQDELRYTRFTPHEPVGCY